MDDATKYFHLGMLAALAVVAQYEKAEILEAIVATTDAAELVAVARADGQMRMSGLARYGYGKKYPAPPPVDSTLRAQLVAVIVAALRENSDPHKTPHEIAQPVIQATGLRRATWAALTGYQQRRLVHEAITAAHKEEQTDAL